MGIADARSLKDRLFGQKIPEPDPMSDVTRYDESEFVKAIGHGVMVKDIEIVPGSYGIRLHGGNDDGKSQV